MEIIASLVLVACLGWWLVCVYKRNKRAIMYRNMNNYLIKHPATGKPNEYFIDALGRKFKDYELEECDDSYVILYKKDLIGRIKCTHGILRNNLCTHEPEHKEIVEFLKRFNDVQEWVAMDWLMKQGCYGMKM